MNYNQIQKFTKLFSLNYFLNKTFSVQLDLNFICVLFFAHQRCSFQENKNEEWVQDPWVSLILYIFCSVVELYAQPYSQQHSHVRNIFYVYFYCPSEKRGTARQVASSLTDWLTDSGLNRTKTETLCKNRNSCFRLRTARNTGIPATTVRKKAGRLLSCASISLSLSETNAEEIKSSCFLPDSCSRCAGIYCSPKLKAGISVLAQSFGFGSVQPLHYHCYYDNHCYYDEHIGYVHHHVCHVYPPLHCDDDDYEASMMTMLVMTVMMVIMVMASMMTIMVIMLMMKRGWSRAVARQAGPLRGTKTD